MPKYEFECYECSLRFSRILKVGEHSTHTCPNCQSVAPRIWEGFGGHTFSEGATPSNSGVHDHDYPTADKAVGRSSSTRWEEYQERKKLKDEVRAQSGSQGVMRRTGKDYIEYSAVPSEVMKIRKPFVNTALHQLAHAEKVPA